LIKVFGANISIGNKMASSAVIGDSIERLPRDFNSGRLNSERRGKVLKGSFFLVISKI
jgi:hypothetical protein